MRMPANLSFDNSNVFEGEVDLELGGRGRSLV
jgi:hypothetical protein